MGSLKQMHASNHNTVTDMSTILNTAKKCSAHAHTYSGLVRAWATICANCACVCTCTKVLDRVHHAVCTYNVCMIV